MGGVSTVLSVLSSGLNRNVGCGSSPAALMARPFSDRKTTGKDRKRPEGRPAKNRKRPEGTRLVSETSRVPFYRPLTVTAVSACSSRRVTYRPRVTEKTQACHGL